MTPDSHPKDRPDDLLNEAYERRYAQYKREQELADLRNEPIVVNRDYHPTTSYLDLHESQQETPARLLQAFKRFISTASYAVIAGVTGLSVEVHLHDRILGIATMVSIIILASIQLNKES